MPCTTPCDQCDQSGMPILFTRYAVGYSSTKAGSAALAKLKPGGHYNPQPGGVGLQMATYNVRMLRPGYLYIRIESIGRRPEWKGYVVHPHGYLTAFDVEHPQDASAGASCRPNEWGASRSMVWIEDPKSVTRFNFLFNPDPIDYARLTTAIDTDLPRHTQSLDVAGWFRGSKSGPDTEVPAKGAISVAEFKALTDEAVRNALEPQLYGLMGSSVPERAWGDYEDSRVVETDDYLPTGDYAGKHLDVESVFVKQLDYRTAHGLRLERMAAYLDDKGGAIVACEDALGIAQELGHLQAEAQSEYTRWQTKQASLVEGGINSVADGVSNEWVFQTAMSARALNALVKQGAVEQVEKRIEAWNQSVDRYMANQAGMGRDSEETRAIDERHAQLRARVQINQQRERAAATSTVDKEYDEYFDDKAAQRIIDAQGQAYRLVTQRLNELGQDQANWLGNPGLQRTVERYTLVDARIDRAGGGAALSVQLAQCLTGLETNAAGLKLLESWDPFGVNLLARMLAFNSDSQQAALKKMFDASGTPFVPEAEPVTRLADKLSDTLKAFASYFLLGDKALAFIEDKNVRPLGDGAALRRLAWAGHVATLMSVKTLQGVKGLPVAKAEASLVKYTALTGVSTLGTAASKYAPALSPPDQDRVRNAARKLQQSALKAAGAAHAAPEARAGAVGAMFDLSLAIFKGYQLQGRPDARTAWEMSGNLLQSIGSLADLRAKAYEETIFKGVRARNIFTAPAMVEKADQIGVLAFKSLRLTALRFLGPAAVVSIWWDTTDAITSWKRNDTWMSNAQAASVIGTACTILGSGAAYLGIAGTTLFSAAAWATTGAVLGLVGGLLILGAMVATWWFKKEDWVYWLTDIPLNKQRSGLPPIHRSLQETLQKLANAQGSLSGTKAAGQPG